MATKKTQDKRLIQISVSPEVKRWIEQQAKADDRSQAWLINKILEDAYTGKNTQKARV